MTKLWKTATLLVANLLIPAAVLTFAAGFFPYKPFLPGLAKHDVAQNGELPPAQFDKVILMVVDALRSDFVFGKYSGFKFTQRLITNGAAVPFTAHATSPTVTMPRVKALTTGSIPSFLDVILNFAESDTTSTLAYQDTWLAQIKAKGGNLVMHGDDTWLKLFPDFFYRADGTTSFFVSDFTEVDNNVTRHVQDELFANDWNALILHYLGLDHIGHKAGPLSPNMIPKQEEMDHIVQQIFTAMERQPSLHNSVLVLCGDHGMTDGGNHGGSAPGETSPALVFISPKLKSLSKSFSSPIEPDQDFDFYTKVEQSDIVPTLAGLLGLPMSLNNLGVFISDFLPLWKDGIEADHVKLLLNNARQILTLVRATFPHEAFDNPYSKLDCSNPSSSSVLLACKWRRVTDIVRAAGNTGPAAPVIVPALADFCESAQEIMSSAASNYNLPYLVSGTALSLLSATLALISVRSSLFRKRVENMFFAAVVMLYGLLMFASSYVEEEHHYWYWTTAAWIISLYFRAWQTSCKSGAKAFSAFSKFRFEDLLLLHRIVRAWNQSGQKHAGAPDLVTTYLIPHPFLLWSLTALTYIMFSISLGDRFARMLPQDYQFLTRSAAAGITVPAFVFKLSFTARDAPEIVRPVVGAAQMRLLEGLPLVTMARVVFIGCFLGVLWITAMEVWARRGAAPAPSQENELLHGLHVILSIFLVTQTRAHNIPLFLLFSLELGSLRALVSDAALSKMHITLSTLLFAQTSFFALGNTNAISSVDLSNAYNGVAGYDVIVVGMLVFLSNWSGPIWWAWAGLCMLADCMSEPSQDSVERPESNGKAWIEEERERLRMAANPKSPHLTNFPDPPFPGKSSARSADDGILFKHLATQTLFISSSLLAVMLACTALRTHLFIWTVFSPKYLYAMAWSLCWHLVVCCSILGSLWWTVEVR